MSRPELFVTLGPTRYRVERPWGEVPPGPGKVSDVAVHASGRIVVLLRRDSQTDDEGPSVIVLSPDGRREAAWGEAVVDGHMLGCAPDGHVYVVDRDVHEVTVFDLDGRRQGGLGRRGHALAPFNHPTDVAFGSDGEVFVADGYAASLVHRFRGERHLGSWGAPGKGPGEFTTPHAIWTLSGNRIVVADRDNSRLQVFSAEQQFLAAWGDHYKPMDIASDPHGNLLVTDQVPRLSLISPEGTLLGRCRPVLNGAHGIACGPDGIILLAEINPSRITRLVPVA